MITIISRTSSLTYKYLAKPILFKFKPDSVHNSLVKFGSRLQKSRTVNYFLRVIWAYKNETMLSQNILGIKFHNPVGLSAGFDKNFELAKLFKATGFGFMEGGSLTFRECEGNPRPWFHRLPNTKSLVVYAGLANKGVKAIIKTLNNYPSDTFQDFPLNISVAKTNSKETCTDKEAIADYVGSLMILTKANSGDMYTLNISCPNTYGGEPFTTPERLKALLSAVDQLNIRQPVFIKMPAHLPWNEFKELLKVADKHAIAGVTISNLAKDRGQAELMDPLPETLKGNLSGRPTWDLSNDLIRKTYRKYNKRFVIIGVGGIFSAEDAYVKIKLGASLVELITGMIFEGPQLIGQINKGLAKLLEQDGYQTLGEAIGTEALDTRE
ncbi:MAG TPA: quinone-dependent dihydroorotate dehydrogenase [Candidatus Saccharibacteria bacterium]|nr:quinone-dependent dihydroorotate dehydrogenase [Candidatus Saccharibacteria bacterium]